MSSRVARSTEPLAVEPVSWPSLTPAVQAPAPDPSHRQLEELRTALANSVEELRTARARIAELEEACVRGEAAARQKGVAEGTAAARQTAEAEQKVLLERISRAVADVAGMRTRIRRESEGDLVKLALAISRRITHREMSIDPDALLGVVRSALSKVPAGELTRVRLHPGAVATVRFQLENLKVPSTVEVEADASLQPGDLFLETVSGILDASIDTQLREIERGFCDQLPG